ncbi:MAG TPA: hypothetical protein DCP02_00750, partial [Actinobacteria bacterium]|nr:hypothetical protein [Actinomycetota bacterium]
MGWYVGTRNTVNEPCLDEAVKDSITRGKESTINKIVELIIKHNKKTGRACIIALDGYIGASFIEAADMLSKALKEKGLKSDQVDINSVYLSKEKIEKFEKTYLTEDPSFGVVCNKRLKDIMDTAKIKQLKQKIAMTRKNN